MKGIKMSFEIDAVVEISLGSKYKYEVDKSTGKLVVDRPLPRPLPYNYGYIPNTLHADGDPLDVCILGSFPIHPLANVKVVLFGALKCTDNGLSDDKLLGFVAGESHDAGVFLAYVEQVKQYLSTYKEGFVVGKFVDKEEAYFILMKDLDTYLHE